MYNENEEDNKGKGNSLYNYNMMFNKIGNYNKNNDNINIDTNYINDIDLRNFNPKRYEYYTNLIKIYNDDPEILYNLLNKYNSIKYMKEREKKIIKEIYNYAVNYEKKGDSPVQTGIQAKETFIPSEWKTYLINNLINDSQIGVTKEHKLKNVALNQEDYEKINKKELDEIKKEFPSINEKDYNIFNNNGSFDKQKLLNTDNLDKSIMKGIDIAKLLAGTKKEELEKLSDNNRFDMKGGNIFDDDALKAKYLNTQKYNKIPTTELNTFRNTNNTRNSNINVIKTNNKIEQLSNEIDLYNSATPDNSKTFAPLIMKKINKFENDPKNPIQDFAITFDDRIVFIIVTFFIRYISLIMVQWCIDINIIKTFYEGFIYYAIIYIILFWFVVLFVNIDNSYDVKYMNFNGIINSIRSLFYYFYMGTNGISRLLIHTSLILLLIIIPIVLNIKKKSEFIDDEQKGPIILTIEERKQLSKSLSLFTIFIWLFTSIIATKF
jgi:hypothetical protein